MVISVKDEGIGIDPQKQQNLFQRFETLVNNNILQPSSGIGLSLVKELIELHQGNIRVNTETGVGSEFIVLLPLDQKVYERKENTEFILNDIPISNPPKISPQPTDKEENTKKTEVSSPINDNTEEEPVSVLIVEDNVELRDFLNNILSGT